MYELEELRRANPISVTDAPEHVALERPTFIDAVSGQGWEFGETSPTDNQAEVLWLPRRMATAALAGAAVIVALIAVFVSDPFQERSVIEASVAAPIEDGAVVVQSGGRVFDRSVDLLVVHLDFAERSDSYAAAATYEVVQWFDLDPLVVAGTQDPASGVPVDGYATAMDATFARNWLDAGTDRMSALDVSADRWLSTLDAQGQVWIAEGGASDFTADVVNEIAKRRPGLDTQTHIHVVQHRSGHEQDAMVDALAIVREQTNYQRVDDGANANTTADLSGESEGFEAAVTSGTNREQWQAAFDFASTSELDFSDVVALLEVLNVSIEHVADAADFAAFFIGDQPDAALRGES